MGLFLGFLSCSNGLYFYFCASTCFLSWWLYHCSTIWSQGGWFLLIPFCTHSFASPILKLPPVRLRFPSSSAIAFHILSWYNKSYISLQQPRTDFYIGIGYSPPPSPHPQEQNKTKQNNCFLTFNMSGWCQTLFMESQKSLLFLCKREVLSSRECFRTFIYLEMT